MITLDAFLTKYKLTKTQLEATDLAWDDLLALAERHKKERPELVRIGRDTVSRLRNTDLLHSARDLVKSSEQVIEAVVRKKLGDPTASFSALTYDHQIPDLITVRALYLSREEWPKIHEFITETWELSVSPCAFYRRGDTETTLKYFLDRGCRVDQHDRGYRTVQYFIKNAATRVPRVVEIQVRTVFEEAWSEIDRMAGIRGTNKHPLMAPYLSMLSRFAGEADELGSLVKKLSESLSAKDRQMEELERSRQAVLKSIDGKISSLSCGDAEKIALRSEWERLKTLDEGRSKDLSLTESPGDDKRQRPLSAISKPPKVTLKSERQPVDLPRPEPHPLAKKSGE